MSQPIASPEQSRSPLIRNISTLWPLAAGISAGPLFVLIWTSQAFTRDGFEPARHPLSLLSLGSLGWIQITNFIVTGVLLAACAAGLRRAMNPGPGAIWAPRLVGAFGAGLVIAGAFVTDAGAGFPPGATEGTPAMSWHGALHELGYAIAVISWTAACFVLLRRYVIDKSLHLARLCVATFAVVVTLSVWPDDDTFGGRILVATAIEFALVAAVAASQLTACRRDQGRRVT